VTIDAGLEREAAPERTAQAPPRRRGAKRYSVKRKMAVVAVRKGVYRCFGSIALNVARGLKLVTIMAPTTRSAISRTRANVSASKLRRPSCANPRAIASPSASSELEGELALGAHVQNRRGTAPTSSHSAGATMKLGSSRGMNTKCPRGSERSRPCQEL
jgi:hypothetical protein